MPRGLRLPKVVRITASLDPEVAKVFQRMSEVSGVSLGRTIGAWCEQTADGARVVIDMMSQAKDAPRFVMSQFHQRAVDAHQDLEQLTQLNRDQAPPAAPTAQPAAGGGGAPKSSVSRLPSPRPVTRGERSPHSGLRKAGRG